MKARDLMRPMTVVMRPVPENFGGRFVLTVCINQRPPTGIITVSCGPRGGFEIVEAVRSEIAQRELPVTLTTIKCLGLCEKGPNARLSPSNSWFHGIRVSDVPSLVDAVERQLRGA